MSELDLTTLKEIMSACSGADEAMELTAEVADREFPELGYDSLAVLEIVSQLQRRYGIVVPDDDVERLRTPDAVVRYVNASRSGV